MPCPEKPPLTLEGFLLYPSTNREIQFKLLKNLFLLSCLNAQRTLLSGPMLYNKKLQIFPH